jgi:predicted O-methyltransferase YrrM
MSNDPIMNPAIGGEISFAERPISAAETSFLIPFYRSNDVGAEMHSLWQSEISMLHPDVLILLYHFARYADGGILEIGPYKGGSTIALAKGKNAAQSAKTFVSVERGGVFEHPTMGSSDIVNDLNANLSWAKVTDQVRLIVGDSKSPEVVDKVSQVFFSEKISLLFMDADGKVADDVKNYKHLIGKRLFLIADDYYSVGAPDKEVLTRESIAQLKREFLVTELGVFGWGTWVGLLESEQSAF